MSPSNPSLLIYEFVLERVSDEPLERRAQIYRALATVIGREDLAAQLIAHANSLDEIERRHAQLVLDFKRGAKG